MKIGVITYDYQPPIGGLGRSVGNLLRALRKQYPNNDYTVLSPSKSSIPSASSLARWWWGRPGGCPVFSLSLVFSIKRFIRRFKLDLLHVHSGSGGVFILRKPPCRMVVTAHHTYSQEAAMVFQHSRLRQWWKLSMARLERRTYRLADKIICVSADTQAEIITRYAISPHKVTVIENSVDIERFAHRNGFVKDANTISYLGRIEQRKGIWVLLRAFARLKRKHPLLTLRLIGENLIGTALQSSPEFCQMQGSITIIENVNDHDFLKEIQQATIVVVPSLIEGFGLIAAESMTAGTFVVASACDGLKQVVTHRKTGLLFKPGDSESCAQAIEEGLLSAELRKSCERRAAEEALGRFSPVKQAILTQEYFDQFTAIAR